MAIWAMWNQLSYVGAFTRAEFVKQTSTRLALSPITALMNLQLVGGRKIHNIRDIPKW
jgi:hypothetical protein